MRICSTLVDTIGDPVPRRLKSLVTEEGVSGVASVSIRGPEGLTVLGYIPQQG